MEPWGTSPGAASVDEHATLEDLQTVFSVHAFAAFDYLCGR